MNFYKECFRWLGDGLKPLLEKLKKQQVEELEKAFEEIKQNDGGQRPKPLRQTKTE